MRSLITSYLLQSKECVLPGIGVLKIIHTPASTDAANNKLLPPFEQVIFKRDSGTASAGLVNYIAAKKNIELPEAENLLNSFCNEWKEKINAGKKLTFETLGSLHKDAEGSIVFERERSYNFLQPVSIESSYQKVEQQQNENHLAVTEQPAIIEEGTYKEEVVVERSYWGLWALILLAIGLVMLFYHFKDHKLTGSSAGNQHKNTVDTATATYRISK